MGDFMLSRQEYINEITSKLAWIKGIVEFNSSMNLLDCNIHMEYFLIGLLDKIYGYKLVNLNAEEKNFTSIDLGDREKRIAIQVTSDNTSTKIKETLKRFFENKYDDDFNTLIIVIVGSKKNYTAKFEAKNGFDFSQAHHIWDFKKLFDDISNKKTEEIKEIACYLRHELAPSNGYVGAGPFSVATDMRNKVRALCISKMMAIDLTEEIANAIIQEELTTEKYQYILDEAHRGKRYLVGGFGSGKSHAVLLLCQRLLDRYASGTYDAISLYAHARELRDAGSIQNWIENNSLHGMKYILFIDGLDEVDYAFASSLIEEERYLSQLHPDKLIIICSRPMTYLPSKDAQLDVHYLEPNEQKQLISKVSSKAAMYFSPHTLTQEMNACIKLPLFCIIYALLKGSNNLGFAKNKIDLITIFVEKALKKISETNKAAYDDLMSLAICTTKADYGDIHLSDVTLKESLDTILKTGLVVMDSDYLSFPLAIIPQFLAAKALQYKKIDSTEITSDTDKVYQWKYPLSILLSLAPFEETFELFSTAFCSAPGLAAQIVSDGSRLDYRDTLPPALECGKKMIRCMEVWEKVLGPLYKYLVPKSKDNKFTLSVATRGRSLAYSWQATNSDAEVTVKTFEELMLALEMRSGPVPAQSNWPWIVTFKMLSDRLEGCIKNRTILGNCEQLRKEYLWNNALLLAKKGSLCHDSIPVSVFDSYKKYADGSIIIKKKVINLSIFFPLLELYADEKNNSLYPPFPVDDQEYSGYVWSCYSQKRFLELTRFVFLSALNEYSELMLSEFSHLAQEMYTAQLIPCKLVGNLEFDLEKELDRGPVLHWHLLALPKDEVSTVDIDYRAITHELDEVDFIYENHQKNRPNLRGNGFVMHGQALSLNCPTPVTDIVYEWLCQELKKLGWINR